MKISYRWLKQYLGIDLPAEEVSRILTNCGLEVENLETIETVRGGLKGVVIGEVKTCIRHPNSDHLSITTVDVGTPGLLTIVCGAPNVRAGQKVPVATVGTVLYQGDQSYEIKLSKIRGELSQGMICAEDELGLGTSHAGIMELPPGAPVGQSAAEYFQIKNAVVFEIGLTPNRTDAMSHLGVARDLLAALKSHDPAFKDLKLQIPSVEAFRPDDHSLPVMVEVEDTEACPRYSGVSVTGVQVGESPEWMKAMLTEAGVRPINNVVDISNFVMLETGQPLHFFDADEIIGHKIMVKKLPEKTPFVTLDKVTRELSGNDLMICNSSEGMCIAGVFGGMRSGVSRKTTRIFLESAHFAPKGIRKTSKYHGLQTDSSFRFERGVDPNGTLYALKRAALLLKELAGGSIASEIVDVYPHPIAAQEIRVRYEAVDRLIGKKIPHDQIRSILHDTGIRILSEDAETLLISVPTYKLDVTREADVIEEILRIYGYNNVEIPAEINASVIYWEKPDRGKIREVVSGLLTGIGFSEIMNNSLTNPDYYEQVPEFIPGSFAEVLNPLSRELKILRQTMLFGGLESMVYNINRKSPDLKFFEFGKTYHQLPDGIRSEDVVKRYRETEHIALFVTGRKVPEHWDASDKTVDFFYLKAVVMNILQRLGIDAGKLTFQTMDSSLLTETFTGLCRQGKAVEIGTVHRTVLARFNIRQEVFYADLDMEILQELLRDSGIEFRPLPRFPEVRRDLALLLSGDIQFAELEKLAFQVEKRLLKRIRLFDVFEGEKIGKGKKSYAIAFFLQDDEKTLTDAEIDQVMKRLMSAFEHKFQAVIR
ncbi:MAG TPA: phenylalanine--tRNA ligase subunit beta [Bacteroidales bacterium]|nr:phenylalanine--tRNA ligase subunit beta [Bacteroidales bacterium]HRZ20385.1 phenylalanine--tRNA ligase subunit beta [Bacteroidales bacterium]